MGWALARHLSAVAYREMSFQAIYALRQGNQLPTKDREELGPTSLRRVRQSKVMVGFLLGLMGVAGAGAIGGRIEAIFGAGAPVGVYQTAVIAGVLLLQLSLLWTTSLQILPTFLGSRTLGVLETLPVDPADLDRAGLLLFLRLFDLPCLAILIVTPLAMGFALGSPLAGLALVPGVAAVVLVALALALATGRYFVRSVEGSPTGFRSTVVRWGFLVLWAVPAFAIYAFISFSPELLRTLGGLASGSGPYLIGLLLLFPFPFAVLPATLSPAAGPGSVGLGPLGLGLVGAMAVLYSVGLVALARWLASAPRRMALDVPEVVAVRRSSDAPLAGHAPVLALLLKDLRIASRTPGFAFVVLLPLLDAAVIGLSTFVGAPSASSVFNLGAAAVSSSALLATFFGPAFFATEVMGYSYGRTLPITNRALLAGKVGLVVLVYTLSALIVLAFTLARVFSPLILLAFVGAELPALCAAALLELGVLFRVSAKRGLAVTNLYTGAWWATVVVIPGVVVAGFPLALFSVLGGGFVALGAMGLAALAELAVLLPLALRWTGGGPA